MGKKLSVAPKKAAKRAGGKNKGRRVPGRYVAVGVVVLAALLRLFVVQGYRVPSRAMEDTLLLGDCLLIEKLSFGASLPFGSSIHLPGMGDPKVGDVIVFRLPEEPERVYVKRCLATAGQIVEIIDKIVYIDGVRLADPAFSKYIDARIFAGERSGRDNFGPIEVPIDSIFLVGDNRDNSRDSRHWGFVPVDALVGRALFVYWSISARAEATGSWVASLSTLPGRVRWQRLGEWVR